MINILPLLLSVFFRFVMSVQEPCCVTSICLHCRQAEIPGPDSGSAVCILSFCLSVVVCKKPFPLYFALTVFLINFKNCILLTYAGEK